MLSGVSLAIGAGAVDHQEAVKMDEQKQLAKRLYADATRAALDAVTKSGRGDVEALTPIIAADAAVLQIVRGILDATDFTAESVLVELEALAAREQSGGVNQWPSRG